MVISTSTILDVLASYDIHPEDDPNYTDIPGIGKIGEGETAYSTSINQVFGRDDEFENGMDIFHDDDRLWQWQNKLSELIESPNRRFRRLADESYQPPEPHCAWYCPIHFFGYGWGIFIREDCVLSHALDIAKYVHWPSVRMSRSEIVGHLLRSAFYVFFLHEQFHHKVESLGFRLLVSRGTDCYRRYKQNVYRRTYLLRDCLEESLANAESYRRLSDRRIVQRVDPIIRDGLRSYLQDLISLQPPGYNEGLNYLSEASYRGGLYELQSQILDGRIPPITPPSRWSIAPYMITPLADIADEIYVVLPRGAWPIFRPTSVDPGATASSAAMERALKRHYGYKLVPGGKGSHVKLRKQGAQQIILPGNCPVLSPGVVKQVLRAIGGYPISRLPDLLEGKLQVHG